MNISNLIVALPLALLLGVSNSYTQNSPTQSGGEDVAFKIVKSAEKPELIMDISSAIRLKIAVRKRDYTVGEMLVVDIAILSDASVPTFIPSIQRIGLLTDGKLMPYVITTKSAAFTRLDASKLETTSFSFLLGCEEKPFDVASGLAEGRSPAAIFEQNLFISWGDGCLNVESGSQFTIKAELVNNSVVVSDQFPKVKTLVGRIVSTPIAISIKR